MVSSSICIHPGLCLRRQLKACLELSLQQAFLSMPTSVSLADKEGARKLPAIVPQLTSLLPLLARSHRPTELQ